MERLRAAHEQWSHARALVVWAAYALVANFDDVAARGELRTAVKAERRARREFERALKEESVDGQDEGKDA